MTYGSGGVGSAAHMNAEQFRAMARFDALHVPYRGTPEMMADIIAGRVDFGFISTVSAIGAINGGKLIALACGAEQRSSLLPDVPTTVEAGVPNSAYNSWLGMFTTGGTPPGGRRHSEPRDRQGPQDARDGQEVRSDGRRRVTHVGSGFRHLRRQDLANIAALVKLAKIPTN